MRRVEQSVRGACGIAEVVYSLGYLGLAVLVALENLLPPIPPELILPLAGFLVSQGRLSFVPVGACGLDGGLGGWRTRPITALAIAWASSASVGL